MPVTPHIIQVTLKDTDNTTLRANAHVYVRNLTKRTQSADVLTDATGVANIDLANLDIASGQTVPYATGDSILIIAYYGNSHDAALYTVSGGSKSQALCLNPIPHYPSSAKTIMKTLIVANTSSTNYYARAIAVGDGQILAHIECLANTTVVAPEVDLPGDRGVVIERENTGLICTAVLK